MRKHKRLWCAPMRQADPACLRHVQVRARRVLPGVLLAGGAAAARAQHGPQALRGRLRRLWAPHGAPPQAAQPHGQAPLSWDLPARLTPACRSSGLPISGTARCAYKRAEEEDCTEGSILSIAHQVG